MKKFIALVLAVMMALTLVACGKTEAPTADDGAAVVDDPAIELRYATHMSSTSDTGVLLQGWLDEINAQSNGTITVTPYWQASLVAPNNSYSETVAGVTDMETVAPGFETDHFILENALTYLYCGQLNCADQIAVAHELWEQCPDWQSEFEGVEVLGFGSAGSSFHILSTTPIKSLADLKGMDIRVMEQWAFDLMRDLGANPIKMPLSEMYEGLQKGVIDGVLLCKSHYLSENLTDYVSYITDLRITPAPCVWHYINADAYNKLSDNQKDILKTTAAKCETDLIDAFGQWDEKSEAAAAEKNIEIFSISDADLAVIQEIAQQNAKDKVAELDAAGYDGTGIYTVLQGLIDARK